MFGPIDKADKIAFGIVDTPMIQAKSIGSGSSGFVKASELNLGPGIARQMPVPEAESMIERIRFDNHDPYGDHLNYEYKVPGIKKLFFNIHIPLESDD